MKKKKKREKFKIFLTSVRDAETSFFSKVIIIPALARVVVTIRISSQFHLALCGLVARVHYFRGNFQAFCFFNVHGRAGVASALHRFLAAAQSDVFAILVCLALQMRRFWEDPSYIQHVVKFNIDLIFFLANNC